MTARLAIGIGCRKGCSADPIMALVAEARGSLPGVARLFSIVDKLGEPGLRAAADTLKLDLVFLSREALQAAMPAVITRSVAAEARFGVASVAEAAALAGAGPGAHLLVPRLKGFGATCAIAIGSEAWP